MKHKLTIGQEVFVAAIDQRTMRYGGLYKATISKVGRDYFYIEERFRTLKFSTETLKEQTSGNYPHKVYLTEQELLDENEKRMLKERLDSFFGFSGSSHSLSLDQLKRIQEIVDEK